MTREINVQAAANRFLAQISGNLGAYMEACLHCGHCADACHFYAVTDDPRYTPAYKLFPMARTYKRSKPPLSWFGGAPKVTEKDLQEWEELLFDSCTMCGRCTMVCPMGIDIASIVAASRQAFVAAGLGPPDLLQAAENARDKGSPLGVSADVLADRVEWLADDNEVDIPLDKEKADVLLTVSSIELMKYPDSLVAMAKLLNHAGIDWTLSSKGYEATNFGFLSGRSDIAKIMIQRIVDAAESVGAKTVVIPECGHAYGVLRWAGANILGKPLPFEVVHITEFLADLKRRGKLKLKPMGDAVTYHDPCQISRRGGATQAARDLLDGFATDFREMTPTGNHNWCCGGGGGVQAMSRAAGLRHKVFKLKMDQVEQTGADTMLSACANCRLTMDESKEHWHWDKDLGSLVEVLAEHIDESNAAA
ncbi:MAG: (Fe-S)-binding protein [Gammaproteobacteria bacterium]|nr:(Fe-S)-binding protein [Gammaproteobacteria bacterium]MDH4255658.1 (Fe-S)-binding protein [Gammaproteobacteria bacterium]MDH5311206.1 (Fe-S)-binding protein [Gammaproteobacteria bacterium]